MNGAEQDSARSSAPYFGSDLFFKHLILAAVIIMILVPTVFAVLLWSHNSVLWRQLSETEAQLEAAQQAQALLVQTDAPDDTARSTEASEPTDAEVPAYTQLYPELYAPEVVRGTEDIEKSVYLTFDDGPSERTDEILKILDEYGVKATFFVVGSSDEAGLARLRAIVEAGHTLAIHSYTHDYLTIYSSVEAYLADFNEMYCQIVEATGVAPRIFRFPGGSINGYNGNVYREIIAEMTRRGFVFFDWNATNGDAASTKLQNAEVLAANALGGLNYRRAIVLMHDSAPKTTTVAALPAIIEGYRDAGYSFHPLTAETRSITFGYRN